MLFKWFLLFFCSLWIFTAYFHNLTINYLLSIIVVVVALFCVCVCVLFLFVHSLVVVVVVVGHNLKFE